MNANANVNASVNLNASASASTNANAVAIGSPKGRARMGSVGKNVVARRWCSRAASQPRSQQAAGGGQL